MKILRWIDRRLEEVILAGTLSYITLCMILQVFMRHVVGESLSWSEESIRFVFIWMIFMGFGIGVRENRHISILVVRNAVPDRWKTLLCLTSNLAFLGYSCFMVYYGFQVVASFNEMGQTSPALGIPMALVYLAAPVGFSITILRLVQSTAGLLKNGYRDTIEKA